MRLACLTVQNVRSYRDQTRFDFGARLNILIGPNGGGKTNLLDILTLVLLNFFFRWYRFEKRGGNLTISSHVLFFDFDHQLNRYDPLRDSIVTVDVLPESSDADNITRIQHWLATSADRPHGDLLSVATIPATHIEFFRAGRQLRFLFRNNSLEQPSKESPEHSFLQYTNSIQLACGLSTADVLSGLTLPLFPRSSNRAQGFSNAINIAAATLMSFMDEWANTLQQRSSGAGWSGLATQYFGRIMREAVDHASETAERRLDLFEKHSDVILMRKYLSRMGYDFKMIKTDLLSYQFGYMKGGRPITPEYFSSGEREIFDFLAGVIATNVRQGVVIIDEPELHLHPRWQAIYLQLFEELGLERGLQFILATHSPVFVTHETISTVTRVYQREGVSRHIAIVSDALPEQAHLIRIVHSHNNERIFFADRVALVEGITDRLVFESLVQRYARLMGKIEICEVVEVHGKTNFEAYAKLLRAIDMPYCIIADLDYCFDVADDRIKALFGTDLTRIDRRVIASKKSRDRKSIAAAIDRAVTAGDCEGLGEVWESMKIRYSGLRENLDPAEAVALDGFIESLKGTGTFILRLGEIEEYLPPYGGRLDKLLELLDQPDWECAVPLAQRYELIEIASGALGLPREAINDLKMQYMDVSWR